MLTVLALSIGCLVYTYVGYPLLIALLAKLRPQDVERDPTWRPLVSVCMSVYDAEAYLDAKLESLLAMDWPRDKLQILVYDDASRDGTAARLEAWAGRDARVRVVTGARRSGKPTALNVLAGQAEGEVLFLTDVRQTVDAQVLRALVAPLADPRVGMVSGALTLTGGAASGMYWRYEKWIRHNEARYRSVVGVSGAVAAIRRSDMPVLPADLILDDVFTPMRLRMRGRIVWLAQDALVFDEAFEDDREFGRKVRTLAGNFQLFALLPALLLPWKNPSWFETVSHKLARLVCPWALLAAAGANLALLLPPGPPEGKGLAVSILGGQAAFYGLSLLGRRAGKLGGLCRTFVVLHVAICVGFLRFVTRRQRVTW